MAVGENDGLIQNTIWYCTKYRDSMLSQNTPPYLTTVCCYLHYTQVALPMVNNPKVM